MFNSERSFQLWESHVSHSRMVIRSPQRNGIKTNIDIYFNGVVHVNVPTSMQGIKLQVGNISDYKEFISNYEEFVYLNKVHVPDNEEYISSEHSHAFKITSADKEYFVIAAWCNVYENSLDIFDSCLANYTKSTPQNDLGKLIMKL